MPIDYELDSSGDLDGVLDSVLNDEAFTEFDSLSEVHIRVCFKVKMDGNDELQPNSKPVETKKVPELHALFMDEPVDYIIVVDRHAWEGTSVKYKKGLVHRGLMAINVEVSSSGAVKKSTKRPDFHEFSKTLERFGTYTPELKSVKGVLNNAAKATAARLKRINDVPPDEEI